MSQVANNNNSSKSFKLAVLISGRGSNLQALVTQAQSSQLGAKIAIVASDRAKAQGLNIAESSGIPTVVVKRNKKTRTDNEFCAELAKAILPYEPDLVILAGFMRVLTTEFLKPFEDKLINIHPSLLPSFVGLNAQAQALEAGVKFAGCSVHYVEEEVDSGPIIAQAVVPVLSNDSIDDLSDRILKSEHLLLPRVVSAIAKGDIRIRTENGRKILDYNHNISEFQNSKEYLISIGSK